MKINNKEEFEKFYPYKNKSGINEYPKEYPCFCDKEWEDAGLMGDYYVYRVAYYPKEEMTIKDAFELGLYYKWIQLKV